MFSVTYLQVFLLITVLWVLIRAYYAFKSKAFDCKRELLLLTVYICLVVIARMVYFPFHLVDGRIEPLNFDYNQILPFWLNLRPFTFLIDRYDGWKTNVIGNIAMFIPVGICWPLCFRKLDTVGKATVASFGLTLLIELTHLLFFERATDVDDLLLNTLGAFIGALLFFAIKRGIERRKKKAHE